MIDAPTQLIGKVAIAIYLLFNQADGHICGYFSANLTKTKKYNRYFPFVALESIIYSKF